MNANSSENENNEEEEEEEEEECDEDYYEGKRYFWFPRANNTYIYEFIDFIEQGGYSSVYSIKYVGDRNENENNDNLIVKIYENENDFLYADKEIEILKILNNSEIIPNYIDSYCCNKLEKYYIIMEKLSMNLREYILSDLLTQNDIKHLSDIINILHIKYGIIHSDIRLDNIGIIKRNNKYKIVLIDFNQSYLIKDVIFSKPEKDFEFYNLLNFYFNKGYRNKELIDLIRYYGVII